MIVDDSALVRSGLKRLLARIKPLRVVGEAQDVGGAIDSIRELGPDVVILDVSMPGGSGLDVLIEAKKLAHAPVVIMFTNHASPLLRQKCLAAGADHFFQKTTEFKNLVDLLAKMARVAKRASSGNGSQASNHAKE